MFLANSGNAWLLLAQQSVPKRSVPLLARQLFFTSLKPYLSLAPTDLEEHSLTIPGTHRSAVFISKTFAN